MSDVLGEAHESSDGLVSLPNLVVDQSVVNGFVKDELKDARDIRGVPEQPFDRGPPSELGKRDVVENKYDVVLYSCMDI